MTYLGDYLGQLMAEITNARMKADIEAVRVAELYASHPLMKNMPIPRFRLPTVEIDLPILINKIQKTQPGDSSEGTRELHKIREAFDSSFTKMVKDEGIRLTRTQLKDIKTLIDKDIESFDQSDELTLNVGHIADRLSLTTSNAIKEMGRITDSEKLSSFKTKLESTSRIQFLNFRKLSSRLDVMVTASEIKEVASRENLTVVRLKISEESYEWTSVDTDDGKRDQLIIE